MVGRGRRTPIPFFPMCILEHVHKLKSIGSNGVGSGPPTDGGACMDSTNTQPLI